MKATSKNLRLEPPNVSKLYEFNNPNKSMISGSKTPKLLEPLPNHPPVVQVSNLSQTQTKPINKGLAHSVDRPSARLLKPLQVDKPTFNMLRSGQDEGFYRVQKLNSRMRQHSSTSTNTPQQSKAMLNKFQFQHKQEIKQFTAVEIQNKLSQMMIQANDEIKDIQISKSSGFLTQELKKKLGEDVKNNHGYLVKLEKLARNPFLQNDYIYNRLLRSAIHFYEKLLHKLDTFLREKIDWIECRYYHWLTVLIKWLQKFSSSDLIQMKQEVANVFNWYQNFKKYIEGMILLEYPTYIKKGRKKSTELKNLEQMSSTNLSPRKMHSGIISSTEIDLKSKQGSNVNVTKLDLFQNPSTKNAHISSKLQHDFKSISIGPNDNKNDYELRVEESIENNSPTKTQSPSVSKNDINLMNYGDQKMNKNKRKVTDLDVQEMQQKQQRMLPKFIKRKEFSNISDNVKKAETTLLLPDFSKSRKHIQQKGARSQTSQTTYFHAPDDELQSLNDAGSQLASISSSNDVNDDEETLINGMKPIDIRKKYLIEAPLSFKMNPPPKIVDLTSDFFEKDTERVVRGKHRKSMPVSPTRVKRERVIINTVRQNAIMVELGKKKIGQLKNFHGKMLTEALLKDFEVLFAPLDETNDATDYLDGAPPLTQTQQLINQTQGIITPNLVHDDMLKNVVGPDGAANGFEFKSSGISMVKRTAQDDYRFMQMNEIQDLKKLLVKRGINVNHNMLQRAILMPEDVIVDTETRGYPKPSYGLMENPFPKVKKPKKKKKKVVSKPKPPPIDF